MQEMTYPATGRLPLVTDRHPASSWAGGAALIAAGSIFMAVTGFEPTKNPSTVWANSWFDLGFAFVVLGLVITAAGVVLHFRREVPPASAPPAVSPADPPPPAIPRVVNQAVWEAVCDESGEFPDTKALTFRLKQVPAPGSAIGDLTALRCTVTDPAGSTVESTGTDSWRQHTPYTFPGAPQVRPGLYRSRWQGRLQARPRRCCGWPSCPFWTGPGPRGRADGCPPSLPSLPRPPPGPGTGPLAVGSGRWLSGQALLASGWWREALARKRQPGPRC